MAKQRRLTGLVVKKDGTIKTTRGKEVDAMPTGRPFNIRTVGVIGGRPDTTYLERELKKKGKDFDAYCVGRGVDKSREDAPRGLPVDEVDYLTYPVQPYKLI